MKKLVTALFVIMPNITLVNPAISQPEPITVIEEIEQQNAAQKKLQKELQQIKVPTIQEPAPNSIPKTISPPVITKPKVYQIPEYVMQLSKQNRVVFIDKSELKLWIIENRKALQSTLIMLGKDGFDTPIGSYRIYSKEQNVTLGGPSYGYEAPVKYWMPFRGGIGLHDANWRPYSDFGNTKVRPKYGSHSCVNLPPNITPTIYNLVQIGTLVIIFE